MMIQAVLGNPHHPEYGVATIPFPIPHDQYAHCMELLEALEIGDAVKADCQVQEINSFYSVLKRTEMLTVNVEELNYLAKRLDSFDTGEAAQFQAMAHKLELFELKDLINLTFCCQQATVITDFSDLSAVGRDHYMNLHGGSAKTEQLDALDGEETARRLIESGSGTITPYGVVYDNGMKLEQVYDGRFFPCYYYEPNAITVAVTSKAEPEDTEHITWLFLPMVQEEIDRALQRAGIADPADVRLRLEDTQLPDEVDVLLDMEQENLADLNALAQATDELSSDDMKKLGAVITLAKPQNAEQIKNLVENLDLFDFAPGAHTPEEYGRYMIQQSGHFDYDENLDEFYDYEGYAMQRMNEEDGMFTGRGYDVMMENHGHELRGAACVIHSDQGSQYLSTTFQRLLSDDGFLQSVSDRGNSQDNAPMESFFGRLKCELLDLVALCPDASTVSRMISGYIDAYNHRHYQYALAGLTPSEYYTYVTTGIYPVDNYYGIKATELMPIQALIAARRRAAEEKAKKYREASAKKRAMAQGKKKDPEFVIARDQRILRREIAKWTRSKELALQQISHLREILELSQKARAYLMTASADLILQLYNGENWGAHPELAYIYKMRELF